MKISQRHATFCALVLSGLVAPAAHGDRGGGIGVDVEIARVLDEIETESAKQSRLDAELAVLDTRRSQLHNTLKSRVRALYRITRSGMTPVAGGFEAIRQHVARVRRLSALVTNDAHALSAAEARSQTARSETGLAATSLGHARERLAALQSQESMSSIHMRDSASGRSAGEPASNAAFYGLRFSDSNSGGTGTSPSASFESQRGRLAAPVTGEVRVIDGRRNEGEGEGLEFQANPGTPVRAAAGGRVAFSDRYGSYGRLVILDHGAGYYTAYGGLGHVEVRVGDDLSPYARIGDIAGDTTRPGLFFEVRKGTRALPPRAWLGL
jgi:septal ring factor EnvC (AmiA/AmiB activator)